MESTVVCIDNSEWTRSGDFAPTRFQAQADAVNLLAGAKTSANPENTVGVLTMAGKSPRVLVTPCPDLGRVLNSMSEIPIGGELNLTTSVQIAQLALKHRQNKNQRQRIVIFAGSPISEEQDKLVKIAKKLKKNNVAVDIVSFGCDEMNAEKLEAFHAAVNSNNNSNLVIVPPGPVLSDVLIGSPIFQGEDGNAFGGAAGAGGGDGYEFGVDPNMDPELALALRVSLEEERARQDAARVAAGGDATIADAPAAGEGTSAAAAAAGATTTPAAAAAARPNDADMDEDALLQQALAMSMQVDDTFPESSTPADAPADAAMADAADDEELQLALQLSMADAEGDAADGAEKAKK